MVQVGPMERQLALGEGEGGDRTGDPGHDRELDTALAEQGRQPGTARAGRRSGTDAGLSRWSGHGILLASMCWDCLEDPGSLRCGGANAVRYASLTIGIHTASIRRPYGAHAALTRRNGTRVRVAGRVGMVEPIADGDTLAATSLCRDQSRAVVRDGTPTQ